MGVYRWRWRVRGEKLDVQGVGVVDGNHALAVIVQILEQDLAQRIHLPRIRGTRISRQEMRRLFQVLEKGGEFRGHGGIGGGFGVAGEDETEVKDEFVAGVGRGDEADRVTENAVAGVEERDGERAERLAGNYGRSDGGKVDERLAGGASGGYDRICGDLVDDFRAWNGV